MSWKRFSPAKPMATTATYSGSATFDTAAIPTGTSDAGPFTNATYPLVDLSLNLDSPLALDQPRANTLSLTLERRLRDTPGQVDPRAYELFLRGLGYFARHTTQDNVYARQMFNQAIRISPDFGRAWAGLAYTYGFEYMYFNKIFFVRNLGLFITRLEASKNGMKAVTTRACNVLKQRFVLGGRANAFFLFHCSRWRRHAVV